MGTTTCQSCYRDNPDGANFCIKCGAQLEIQNVVIGGKAETIPAAKATARLSTTNVLLSLIIILLSVIAYKGASLFTSSAQQSGVASSVAPHEGGSYYQALVSSQTHLPMDERERYAIFNEREIVMNRELPRMLGPTLKLSEVNYKHSAKSPEMDYVFQGTGNFRISDKASLNERLQNRYCDHNEFLMHRSYTGKVNWVYWSRNGLMIHKYTSENCPAGTALRRP